jgi:putative two-component system response regulator
MPEAEPASQILVVDDNPHVSALLRQLLTSEGYAVTVAGDGCQALDLVARRRPDLIFLDLELPRLNGYHVCRRLKADPGTRFIPVVILTAQGELHSKLEAWECGADDFLTKPFHLVEVTTRCRSLLRIKRLVEERDSAEAVVFALARAVEAKSPYTHGHSERVTRYALALAGAAGVPPEEWETLRKGALLHDIGKIRIPDAVLEKPGRLTAAEYEVVKEHARQGAHIVEPLGSLRAVAPLIRWHHERPDGAGYPDGLRGEAIPRLVRVLSVADVYDSLASERPYRAPLPPEFALQALRELALGGGLDPELVALFGEAVVPARPAPVPNPLRGALSPAHHRDVLLLPASSPNNPRV